MSLKIIVFTAVLISTAASLEFKEKCEERYVYPVQNLNATQYTGSWYIVQRYNNSLEGERCNVSLTLNLLNENTTDLSIVVNSAKQNNFTGIAQLQNNTTTEGKYNINFTHTNQNTSEEYNFVILSTNYTSYSVVWLCKDLTNETSSQIIWVLSRDTILEEFKDAAEVNRTLTSNKLNHTFLHKAETTCQNGSTTIFFNLFLLVLLPLISCLI